MRKSNYRMAPMNYRKKKTEAVIVEKKGPTCAFSWNHVDAISAELKRMCE